MKIEEINIKQFRSLNNVHINLNCQHNAGITETFLISGTSASGKTSVLDAIQTVFSQFHHLQNELHVGDEMDLKVEFTDEEVAMLKECNSNKAFTRKMGLFTSRKNLVSETKSWMENDVGEKLFYTNTIHSNFPEILYFHPDHGYPGIEKQFLLVTRYCNKQYPSMTKKFGKIKSAFDNFIEGWKVSTRKDAILEHKNKHFNFSEIPSSIRELFQWFLHIIMYDSQKSFEGNVILMDRMHLLSKLHQATFLAKRHQVFPKFQFIFTSSDVMPDWHHNHQLEGW